MREYCHITTSSQLDNMTNHLYKKGYKKKMIYSINNNETLITYKKKTTPPDINFIDYLEFEINDYNYVLNENDIERIFGGFI